MIVKKIIVFFLVPQNLKSCFSISVLLFFFYIYIHMPNVSNFIYRDFTPILYQIRMIYVPFLFYFLVDISNGVNQPVPVRNESKRRRWLLLLLLLLLLASSGVLTGILLDSSKKYGLYFSTNIIC